MRRISTVLALTAISFSVAFAADDLDASHKLGPLHIGMTRAEVTALHLPIKTSTVNLEGEEYALLTVRVAKNVRIKATLCGEQICDLETTSRAYVTAEGARVGDTLAELRKKYPAGQVNLGDEEGPHFSYASDVGGQVFIFDAGKLGKACVVENRHCPQNLEAERSIRLRVR